VVYGPIYWTPLGGATLSSPAVAGVFGSRIDVVVRGADNGIYHKYTKNGVDWSGWISLGGATKDQPAVAIQSGYLHVVVRGTDNGIYYKRFVLPDGPWDSSWTNVGGATLSTPALAAYIGTVGFECVYLVVRGTDNGIYCKYWTSSGWIASWSKVPGATNDIPAICTGAYTGLLHLVVRGTDNGIYHNTSPTGDVSSSWPMTWSGWTKLPGATISPPTLEYSGYVNLVVRGTDNGVYYSRWSYGWNGWVPLGGATIDRPDLWAYTGGGVLFLFVRGADNGIYQKYMDLSTFAWTTSWSKYPGATSSGPTIEAGARVVRGMDNGIYALVSD